MKSDKKNRNGKITFVLPVATGDVRVISDVSEDILKQILAER